MKDVFKYKSSRLIAGFSLMYVNITWEGVAYLHELFVNFTQEFFIGICLFVSSRYRDVLSYFGSISQNQIYPNDIAVLPVFLDISTMDLKCRLMFSFACRFEFRPSLSIGRGSCKL